MRSNDGEPRVCEQRAVREAVSGTRKKLAASDF